MSNANFNPQWSTNDIWNDVFMEECLTDELDAMRADITTIQSNYVSTSDVIAVDKGGTGVTAKGINIEVTQDTTNTLANTADTDNWAAQVKYYPYLEMCFVRIYCVSANDLAAGTAYVIGTLADTAYAPPQTMPLSTSCGKNIQAFIGPTGNISVKPYEAVYGTVPMRAAGFWFRPSVASE